MSIKPLLLILAGGLLFFGCDSGKKVRAQDTAMESAPADLEKVFEGKTGKSKPVRAYKVILQAPNGEHLLLVLGDINTPVSIVNASTVKVGEKVLTHDCLCSGSGVVFVAKPNGEELSTLGELGDDSSALTFPMDLFNKKIKGKTLNWSELDKL